MTRIILKNANSQEAWEDSTFVLAKGEAGVAVDTGAIRIGNGVDTWANLPDDQSGVSSVNGETGAIVLDKTYVGLDQVDNTPDADKPISGPTSQALSAINVRIDDLGETGGITKETIGLGNVDNTSDVNKPISAATQIALNTKAPSNNPTFTGNVIGVTKSMVGLAQVDNTSDLNKPISTATQAALTQKASSADPRFTDTRTPTAGSVVDASVSNTAAISLNKTADTSTRVAMTPAERTEVAASKTIRQNLSAGVVAAGANALVATDTNTYTDREAVAVGSRALQNATFTNNTVAIGVDSQQASTRSENNIAIGQASMQNVVSNSALTQGANNLALGKQAAQFKTTANNTVSVGLMAGMSRNVNGDVAIGNLSNVGFMIKGLSGTWEQHGTGPGVTGNPNFALGSQSLLKATGGQGNVAIGNSSLRSASDSLASSNVAVGGQTLYNLGSTKGPSNLVITAKSATGTYAWNGSTITVAMDSHNLLAGDYVNIEFKNGTFKASADVNDGQVRALVNQIIDSNTFTITNSLPTVPIQSLTDSGDVVLHSYERGTSSASSGWNTAIGISAGYSLTSGSNNIAIGILSGPIGDVDDSIAIGSYALATGAGANNIAIGTQAAATQGYADNVVYLGNLADSTGDNSNIVVLGTSAIAAGANTVTVGTNSKAAVDGVSVGNNAVGTGSGSVAIGSAVNAGVNTDSVIIGHSASATGSSAVALGSSASAAVNGTVLGTSSTGADGSIIIGQGSVAGSNSIVIASDTTVGDNVAQFSTDDLATSIKGSSIDVGSTAATLSLGGASTVTNIGTSNASGTISIKASLVTVDDVAVTSDQRDKTDIRPTQLGLDFINQIKPVEYRWARRSEDTLGQRFHQGVIAQQVQSVIDETGVDFGGFVDQNVNGGPDQLLVRYDEFIGPLIKAVQELSAEVTELRSRLDG